MFRSHDIPILHGHIVTKELVEQALNFGLTLIKKRTNLEVKTLLELSGLSVLSNIEKTSFFPQECIELLSLPKSVERKLLFLDLYFVCKVDVLLVPSMLVQHIGEEVCMVGFKEEDYQTYYERENGLLL